jgi:hypothetical protein
VSGDRIGEVVEASTTDFLAQSYTLYDAPPFGALVRAGPPAAGGEAIYGVVYRTETQSIDPGRRPIARGRDLASEDDLYRDNPQLPKLLRTDFRALTVGFGQDGHVHQYLPARPPRVHGFVYLCTPEEVIRFTQSLDFFQIIVAAGLGVPADELLAAVAREASAARGGGDEDFLLAAGERLVALLGDDLQRLTAALRRMRPS